MKEEVKDDGKGREEREQRERRLAQTTLKMNSQTAACALVQACTLKALAGSQHHKICTAVRLFRPCSKTGRPRLFFIACICELVIAGGVRNGRPLARTHTMHL